MLAAGERQTVLARARVALSVPRHRRAITHDRRTTILNR